MARWPQLRYPSPTLGRRHGATRVGRERTTMVDWAVAKIRWTIVHRVHQEIDEISKQAPPPILADLVSSLDSLSEKFIQNHILNSLDDYHIRRASFRDTANN